MSTDERKPDLSEEIGNVLDAWEQVPNDLRDDPGYEGLHNALQRLYKAVMEQPGERKE